jgi:hypothetical protein
LSEQALWEQYRDQIEALHGRKLNFDLEKRDTYTAENGWHVDDFRTELPPEPPGPPQPAGSFEAAKKMLREYRFPDPGIITGIFVPDVPLDQRVMLLRASYLWMTFYFGVKVGAVIDERQESERGPEQVWGFSYQTLEGHMERGQMTFTVRKYLQSGQVAFRIQAFSQPADFPNPILRLGFRLFGRRVQLRFVHRSMNRMRELVEQEISAGPPPADHGPPIKPAAAEPAAAEKMDEVQQGRR